MARRRRRLPTATEINDDRTGEKDFMEAVVMTARVLGWLVFHPWTSIHSEAGFPDLTMVRVRDGVGQVIFAELKSERGRPDRKQQEWASALEQCPGVRYFLWRPSDRDQITEVLT